jgi:GAF domain-containing protein
VQRHESVDDLQEVVDELLRATGASRVTLREEQSHAFFPIAREALAQGVMSIKDVQARNMEQQPVVLEIVKGHQVVQNDCLSAFDDVDFQEMLDLYGGMRAQIVTPVMVDGALKGIISVHQLGSPREWTDNDIETCHGAARRVHAIFTARPESDSRHRDRRS